MVLAARKAQLCPSYVELSVRVSLQRSFSCCSWILESDAAISHPNSSLKHNLYMNSDLETRKKTREQAWKVDGWAETVYNTGKQP